MPPGRRAGRPGRRHRGMGVGSSVRTAVLLAALSMSLSNVDAELRGTPVRVANNQEAEVAAAFLRAYTAISRSVLAGEDQGIVIAAAAPPGISSASAAAVASAARSAFAAAVANWQLSVAAAPSNRGLAPQKLVVNGRTHYYQVPADPVGTFVFFHGCSHAASHSWPYDQASCPECLGLPEEVAHTKQALAWGYAVLVPESFDTATGCFSSTGGACVNDQDEMPDLIQAFLKLSGLEGRPIYAVGVSAGAAFASKLPKELALAGWTAFRISGVVSEVNAVEWTSWSLISSKGQLRYPGFPPVAYVQMERDLATAAKIQANVPNLRRYGVNSDFVVAPSRPVNQSWFSDRSPVITPQQSSAIVAAMQQLGVLDSNGWLRDDPRVGLKNSSSPLYQWTQRLLAALPWLNDTSIRPVPDQSDITEEMNVAYSWHEGIADYVRPCLAWLQANGSADLRYLASHLAVPNLAQLTMDRAAAAPAVPCAAPPTAALAAKTFPSQPAVPCTALPTTALTATPSTATLATHAVPAKAPGAFAAAPAGAAPACASPTTAQAPPTTSTETTAASTKGQQTAAKTSSTQQAATSPHTLIAHATHHVTIHPWATHFEQPRKLSGF
ncbi:hypothetical protein ABPG75_008681 [Micractinium tetrahymenae]